MIQSIADMQQNTDGTLSGGFVSVTGGRYRVVVGPGSGLTKTNQDMCKNFGDCSNDNNEFKCENSGKCFADTISFQTAASPTNISF